jgi:3-deoxy-D-manno-octulosonic-acid transferase
MRLAYNISIFFYIVAVRLASLLSPKAALWVKGRQKYFSSLAQFSSEPGPVIWFHCASLGEFEQGRPVIEAFKKQHPQYRILLTFFSPSGFEVRKNYEHADHVCYLPADTPDNAKRFVEMARPALVVFVKYEYWHNIMHEITTREIPLYIMSAIFRPSQYFFKWYGKRFLKNLDQITHFFVQNQNSADLLVDHGITQVSVTGDTRFDRVAKIAQESISFPLVEAFVGGNKEIILAGSTWPADEILLAKLYKSNPGKYKLIIAPHETNESHLQSLESLFPEVSVRYSQARQVGVARKQILIIDSIGLLSKLYRYGRYAYIGGGFGAGIHNVPEAAVYGIPVIFGPNYRKFQEAVDLIENGGAFSINDYQGLADIFRKLSDNEEAWQHSADASRKYVARQLGATAKVMGAIQVK